MKVLEIYRVGCHTTYLLRYTSELANALKQENLSHLLGQVLDSLNRQTAFANAVLFLPQ